MSQHPEVAAQIIAQLEGHPHSHGGQLLMHTVWQACAVSKFPIGGISRLLLMTQQISKQGGNTKRPPGLNKNTGKPCQNDGRTREGAVAVHSIQWSPQSRLRTGWSVGKTRVRSGSEALYAQFFLHGKLQKSQKAVGNQETLEALPQFRDPLPDSIVHHTLPFEDSSYWNGEWWSFRHDQRTFKTRCCIGFSDWAHLVNLE